MNIERIHILLSKYWDCQTTLSEEKELQEFFSGSEIPEDLQAFTPLFIYKDKIQAEKLSDDFETKLLQAIKHEKKRTLFTAQSFLQIAASILLIVGLGISFLFISKENNKPTITAQSPEQMLMDDETAIEQATFALKKVSWALKVSEDASRETLQDLDDLNLDELISDSVALNMMDTIQQQQEIENEIKL